MPSNAPTRHPNTPKYRALSTEWDKIKGNILDDKGWVIFDNVDIDTAEHIAELDYDMRLIEAKFLSRLYTLYFNTDFKNLTSEAASLLLTVLARPFNYTF